MIYDLCAGWLSIYLNAKQMYWMWSYIVGDEVEYLYKRNSYCDDCYRMVKKLEAAQQEKAT